MFPLRALRLVPALLLLAGTGARAQGVPSGTSEPRTVELDVQSTDGGQTLSAEDAARLGLSPDAGDT
ncbi:hypothetical protein D7Y13_41215, partial [Corallococcus praedator]